MDFLEKLNLLMKKNHLNKNTLSKACNIPYTTIDGWYKKGYEGLKLTTLRKLADFFETSLDYWASEDDEFLSQSNSTTFKEPLLTADELTHIKKYRTLDLHGKGTVDIILEREYQRCTEQKSPLSAQYTTERVLTLPHSELKASAGTGFWLDDESMKSWTVLWNEQTRKADFCLDVQGDSMEPMFRDGDIILVRSQPSVEIGEIGLYIIDGNGYVKRQGEGCLESLNLQYENIVPDEFSCIDCKGLVIGLLKPDWIVEQ